MEAEEIRAEIERRKKRAIDLKLRELLWKLYYSYLSRYPDHLKKDPAMILPELKATIDIADNQFRFRLGETEYKIFYTEGKCERDSWRSREDYEETTTTPITLTLHLNDASVFSFNMKRRVRNTLEMPLFSEHMGEVLGFIDGPWVNAIDELVQKMRQHENSVREERAAPRRAQKLREDMKNFGL